MIKKEHVDAKSGLQMTNDQIILLNFCFLLSFTVEEKLGSKWNKKTGNTLLKFGVLCQLIATIS